MKFVCNLLQKCTTFVLQKMTSERPVVIILGTTGVGKSKLSLELCKQFNGEIISADSMQVYKGLDIITNKVTEEERASVPHHIIDYVDPLLKYTVVDFRNQSLPIVKTLLESNKIPVIVGGTNYYIESLLFNVLLNAENPSGNLILNEEDRTIGNKDQFEKMLPTRDNLHSFPMVEEATKHVSNEHLHNLLKEVDPEAALELHPNARRKVLRRLQIYQQHNKTYTELVKEQKAAPGSSFLGGPLRLQNCVVFWLQCDTEILHQRLDTRVDAMMEQGLLNELCEFHKMYNQKRLESNREPDYTEGIFQSIGFKEFHPYLILSEEKRTSQTGVKLLEKCIGDMKFRTRKYAKQQLKWIRNRFMVADRDVPDIFTLDCTDLTKWDSQVLQPAVEILKCKIERRELPEGIKPAERNHKLQRDDPVTFSCDTCDRIIVGTLKWREHLKSKAHEKMRKRKSEQESGEAKRPKKDAEEQAAI